MTTVEDEFPPIAGSEVAVDNGPFSPNSGFNSPEEAGYVFATSEEGVGINFAFEPPISTCSPEVESVSFANVSQEDAELQATVNPCQGETHYTFEYTTRESFEAEGYEAPVSPGKGKSPRGNSESK